MPLFHPEKGTISLFQLKMRDGRNGDFWNISSCLRLSAEVLRPLGCSFSHRFQLFIDGPQYRPPFCNCRGPFFKKRGPGLWTFSYHLVRNHIFSSLNDELRASLLHNLAITNERRDNALKTFPFDTTSTQSCAVHKNGQLIGCKRCVENLLRDCITKGVATCTHVRNWKVRQVKTKYQINKIRKWMRKKL